MSVAIDSQDLGRAPGGLEQSLDLADLWAMFRRRRWQFLIPAILILLISIAIALILPPVYKSEATIMVERQEVPADLVESTVTGYVAERIQAVSKRLMTFKNLWAVAENLDLYPDRRNPANSVEFVQEMRESIAVEMVDVQAAAPDSARRIAVTIAFTISFESHNSEDAQRVVRELTRLVLEENKRDRTEQAALVSEFLGVEAERLRAQVTDLEAKLADFKQDNIYVLPELSDVNMRLFEQTEQNIERTGERIRNLEQQRSGFMAQLGVINPYTIDDQVQRPEERMAVLQAEYLSLISRYSPDHPDVQKVRRELSILERQTGGGARISTLITRLESLRAQLSQARQRYSEEHPDIKRLTASISALEQEYQSVATRSLLNPNRQVIAPDNPTYVSLQSQLRAVELELIAEREKLIELEARLKDYEQRLFETPIVQRDQTSLLRDYDNAVRKYQEIKAKQLNAGLAEQLEIEEKSVRLTVLDSASLPFLPESPNRPGIILLGVVLAFGAGLGNASFVEFFDRSVRGTHGVRTVVNAPPLAGIPYIENRQDRRKKWRGRIIWLLGSLLFIGAVFLAIHLFWMPLTDLYALLIELLAQRFPALAGAEQ